MKMSDDEYQDVKEHKEIKPLLLALFPFLISTPTQREQFFTEIQVDSKRLIKNCLSLLEHDGDLLWFLEFLGIDNFTINENELLKKIDYLKDVKKYYYRTGEYRSMKEITDIIIVKLKDIGYRQGKRVDFLYRLFCKYGLKNSQGVEIRELKGESLNNYMDSLRSHYDEKAINELRAK